MIQRPLVIAITASFLGTCAAAGPAPAQVLQAAGPFERAIASSKASMMGEPRMALSFAQQGLVIAKNETPSAQRANDVATAQWLEGESLVRLDRRDEARPLLDQALATAISAAPNSKLHADLLMARGGLQAGDGKVQTALADFQEAYRLFGAVGQPRGQAKALQFIGSIYQDAGDYARVLKYYEQSAELYRNDPSLLIAAYNNTGNAFKEQNMFAAAESDFKKALAVAVDMKSPSLQARILSNLASAQVEEGKYAAASRSVSEGLRAASADEEGAEWRPFLWGVSARAAQKQGQFEVARALLERMFQGVNLSKTSITYRDFHRTAYETYLRLGDDKQAIVHLAALKRLDDQARDLAASTNTALMSAQFDYANQVTRIAQLKQGQLERDMQLVQSRSTIQRVLLAAATAIMCLLAAAVLWTRRSRNAVRLANGQLSILNRSLEKALQARSDFLATTSHEIRTPLNGILGMTQVILANGAADPVLRDQIRLVHSSGEAMRDLVDDILDVAKIESGKLELQPDACDLHRLLESVVELWNGRAQEKGLELVLDFSSAPQVVTVDAGRLRQLVSNLLSNAVKFTDHGRVTVSALTEVVGETERLVIKVQDTGIGIAAQNLSGVFESFSQIDSSISRLYSGTGLGLSICKSIAEAMGGQIGLTSQLGKGSTFTLRLPLQVVEAPEEAFAPLAAQAVGLGQCAILVIERNPLSQSLLRTVLAGKVRSVVTVGSANEANRLLDGKAFDIALGEIGALTPDGPGEEDPLERLRNCVRLVAVMATNPTLNEVDCLTSRGVHVVIRKPVAAPDLISQLEAAYSQLAQVEEQASELGGIRKPGA